MGGGWEIFAFQDKSRSMITFNPWFNIYRYLLVPTPLGSPVVEGSKPMVSLEASLLVHPDGRQNRVTVVRFQMGSLTL